MIHRFAGGVDSLLNLRAGKLPAGSDESPQSRSDRVCQQSGRGAVVKFLQCELFVGGNLQYLERFTWIGQYSYRQKKHTIKLHTNTRAKFSARFYAFSKNGFCCSGDEITSTPTSESTWTTFINFYIKFHRIWDSQRSLHNEILRSLAFYKD